MPLPSSQSHYHWLPLVVSYRSFLSEAPLTPLQLTTNYFTQWSYEQALCLPTSFFHFCFCQIGSETNPFWVLLNSLYVQLYIHPLMLFPSPKKAVFTSSPSPSLFRKLPLFGMEFNLSLLHTLALTFLFLAKS